MKNSANNQVSEREAQGSSVQTAQIKVSIPKEILATNHRRAYAMAYKAGYQNKKLRFVSTIVRNSIVRGYLDGEEAREREQLNRTVAQLVWETEEAYWNAVHAEVEEQLAEEANQRAHIAA